MRARFMTAVAVAQVLFVIVALVMIFAGDVFGGGGEAQVQLAHTFDCSWWNMSCKSGRFWHYVFSHPYLV